MACLVLRCWNTICARAHVFIVFIKTISTLRAIVIFATHEENNASLNFGQDRRQDMYSPVAARALCYRQMDELKVPHLQVGSKHWITLDHGIFLYRHEK